MIRTFIQVLSLLLTLESAFFLSRGALALTPRAIAGLAATRWDSNPDVVKSLAAQRADTLIGVLLLTAALVLQVSNALWALRWQDLAVHWGAAAYALVLALVLFFGAVHLSRELALQTQSAVSRALGPKVGGESRAPTDVERPGLEREPAQEGKRSMDIPAAAALLNATQQLRVHWSHVLTLRVTLAVTVSVAIVSYFVKGYLDLATASDPRAVSYILAASSLLSVWLGLWRLDAKRIDNAIASLYPDFITYETALGVPIDRGTAAYLMENVGDPIKQVFNPQNSIEVQARTVAILKKDRRVGRRGHREFDVVAALLVLLATLVSLAMGWPLWPLDTRDLFLIGNAIGAALMWKAQLIGQRDPTERDVKDALTAPRA